MHKRASTYVDIVSEISRINELRAEVMLKAFALLELHHTSLAHMLVQNFGNKQRASQWMCVYQRTFDGRSALEVLADGDEDSVWDEISRGATRERVATLIDAHMAH
ncbi:MAG: DUF2384 domain-containing protein [Rhodanobacter sp.]